jgi:hypothetical protein
VSEKTTVFLDVSGELDLLGYFDRHTLSISRLIAPKAIAILRESARIYSPPTFRQITPDYDPLLCSIRYRQLRPCATNLGLASADPKKTITSDARVVESIVARVAQA